MLLRKILWWSFGCLRDDDEELVDDSAKVSYSRIWERFGSGNFERRLRSKDRNLKLLLWTKKIPSTFFHSNWLFQQALDILTKPKNISKLAPNQILVAFSLRFGIL